jgi:hypothetical protein
VAVGISLLVVEARARLFKSRTEFNFKLFI